MLSSVRDTLNLMKDQFGEWTEHWRPSDKKPKHKKGGPNWTDEELDNLLGILKGNMEKVEGSILFNLAGGRRFLPFDDSTVENVPKCKIFFFFFFVIWISSVIRDLLTRYNAKTSQQFIKRIRSHSDI